MPRLLRSFGRSTWHVLCRLLVYTLAICWLLSSGHAALSPREDLLLVHNLTENCMQVHHFPRSLPQAVIPVNFNRKLTVQGAWAEDSKIAVCGSDHDTIYVLDVVMQEVVQKLMASGKLTIYCTHQSIGLIQTIATAQLSAGHHFLIAGLTSGSFYASVWTKQVGIGFGWSLKLVLTASPACQCSQSTCRCASGDVCRQVVVDCGARCRSVLVLGIRNLFLSCSVL